MEKKNKFKEIGKAVAAKTSKEDIAYHYAGVKPDNFETIGKMTDAENSMFAKMVENSTYKPIGRKRLNFLIDVDDVLRNLVPNMVRLYNNEFGTDMKHEDVKDYSINVSFSKVAKKYGDAYTWFFVTHGHELFYDSEAIEGAADAVRKLKKYGTIQIVTKQRSLNSKIDTLMWLEKCGIEYDNVCFVQDKTTVACDFFIDDYHDNFLFCGSDGSTGILIDAPYNAKVDIDLLKSWTGFDKIERYGSIREFADNIEKYI